MDLGTIKRKMDDGKYHTVDQLAADVRLVFDNATAYNRPDSDIHLMSIHLLNQFHTKLGEVAWERPGSNGVDATPPSGKKRKSGSIQSPSIDSATKSSAHAHKAEGLRQENPRIDSHALAPKQEFAPVAGAEHLEAEVKERMTFEEKRILGEKMNQLKNDQLAKVVQIINSSKPDATNKSADDDIEIDMNDLDERTLRQLERYVNLCLDSNDTAEADFQTQISKHQSDTMYRKSKKSKHRKDE